MFYKSKYNKLLKDYDNLRTRYYEATDILYRQDDNKNKKIIELECRNNVLNRELADLRIKYKKVKDAINNRQ